MTPIKRKSFAILRKLYPLLVALFTCLIGYASIYFYAYTKGHSFTYDTSHQVISNLDDLFTELHSTAIALATLNDIDCKTLRPVLEKIVAINPKISSINLLKNNQLYCSSDSELTLSKLTRTPKLLLQQHSPNTAIIFQEENFLIDHMLDLNANHRLIITVMDYQVIQDILKPRLPTQLITLKLHGHTITHQSMDGQPQPIHMAIQNKSLHGYNYAIETGYSKPLNLEVLTYYHSVGLLLVTALAILLYFITHWFIKNVSTAYYELNAAINNNQIRAYAQPIYSTQKNAPIGIEILARWHHPKLGLIRPDTFIPIAEKTGLIIPLTRHLMREVSQVLADYHEQIPPKFHIGFNIAREHCESLQLAEDCRAFYQHLNNPNVVLVIEITERELIEVTDTTKQLFKELHKLNAKIALDDFGVGNSNLSYIYDFAINYLKIDKSFISRIGSDALSKNILDAIIEIAQSCGLESCAEGVETEEQVNYLISKGVTYMQGYFYSPPMPIRDFIASKHFSK